jgi:hypothetical protein
MSEFISRSDNLRTWPIAGLFANGSGRNPVSKACPAANAYVSEPKRHHGGRLWHTVWFIQQKMSKILDGVRDGILRGTGIPSFFLALLYR